MNRVSQHEAAYPDRLTEWLFAIMMIGWGAYLELPMQTFNNPQYSVLAQLAPEQVWGAMAISIGGLRCVALHINGKWRRTPAIRLLCSTFGFVWWLSQCFLIVAAPQEHPPAGLVWYPIFVAFELINCWRSSADGFHSKAFRIKRPPTNRSSAGRE